MIDGDFVVVMCYIEVCMLKIVYEFLVDLDKEIVDYVLNYDGIE